MKTAVVIAALLLRENVAHALGEESLMYSTLRERAEQLEVSALSHPFFYVTCCAEE